MVKGIAIQLSWRLATGIKLFSALICTAMHRITAFSSIDISR
jgi:hypothetical protein